MVERVSRPKTRVKTILRHIGTFFSESFSSWELKYFLRPIARHPVRHASLFWASSPLPGDTPLFQSFERLPNLRVTPEKLFRLICMEFKLSP